MDRERHSLEEMETLRALCDEAVSRAERQKLLQSCGQHNFLHAEHQVVFESIRALLLRGSFSPAQLAVHLTRRGFPDIDAESYFPPATREARGKDRSDKVAP